MAIDIKKLRKIMRTDDGINGDAQRLEELVWLLFLKLFDSKEKEWQLSEAVKQATKFLENLQLLSKHRILLLWHISLLR